MFSDLFNSLFGTYSPVLTGEWVSHYHNNNTSWQFVSSAGVGSWDWSYILQVVFFIVMIAVCFNGLFRFLRGLLR